MTAQGMHDIAREQSGANKPKHRPPAVAGALLIDRRRGRCGINGAILCAALLVNHKIIYRLDAIVRAIFVDGAGANGREVFLSDGRCFLGESRWQ